MDDRPVPIHPEDVGELLTAILLWLRQREASRRLQLSAELFPSAITESPAENIQNPDEDAKRNEPQPAAPQSQFTNGECASN